jgi:hypothetical protein
MKNIITQRLVYHTDDPLDVSDVWYFSNRFIGISMNVETGKLIFKSVSGVSDILSIVAASSVAEDEHGKYYVDVQLEFEEDRERELILTLAHEYDWIVARNVFRSILDQDESMTIQDKVSKVKELIAESKAAR